MTRRTTRSPYADCAWASRSCSPTAPGTSVVGVGRLDREARLHRLGRRPWTSSSGPSPSITVVQALPKGDRGELAVEVLTEIGVDTHRAVGRVPLGRGLEGRAGREVARQVAGHRPRGRPSSRAARGCRPSPPLASTARPRRPLVAEADLVAVLHEDATTPLGAARRAARRRDRRRGRPRGRHRPRGAGRLRRPPARASVRLGAEVLRTSTAGRRRRRALLARTPRWAWASRRRDPPGVGVEAALAGRVVGPGDRRRSRRAATSIRSKVT